MKHILMWLIRVYQLTLSRLLTAVLGPVCRFEPSCSAYAFECVRIHGAWRGALLSVTRLSKCHPFHKGGYDPPPPLPGSVSSSRPEAATLPALEATPSAESQRPATSKFDAG